MTLEAFQALRALQDHSVRLNFNDGQVVIATLVSITSDLDASRHVVYDNVEWSALRIPRVKVSCTTLQAKTWFRAFHTAPKRSPDMYLASLFHHAEQFTDNPTFRAVRSG
jgi:hypothetical protein